MTATGGWAVDVPTGYRVGRWTVTAPIASGSWGSVYAATGAGDAAEMALKFLPTGTLTPRQIAHLADVAARERRGHEQLSHPHLVRAREILTVDDPEHPALDGALVIVMERAEASLRDRLQQAAGGPVPDAERLLEEICDALAYLHGRDWVHGDLKPANVLLMADGSIRLADFGLAGEFDGTHAYLPPMASPDYVPPERWTESLGEHGIAVRPSADVWAFGITAHLLLTGAFPFPGGTSQARLAAAAEYAAGGSSLALSPALPQPWRELIQDCLAPTHAARAQHGSAELLERIRRLRSGRAPSGRRRRRIALAAAAAVAVVTAAVAGVAVAGPFDDRAPSGPTVYRADLLRADAGIPVAYRELIVDAGTACAEPGITPALIAAMLKAESNFDPNLSDPAKDEYGIARWTPSVLRFYLPEGQRDEVPAPPFPPEVSIPAMGRYLCFLAPRLSKVPGDPGLLLAAAYRTSATRVVEEGGPPPKTRDHVARVGAFRQSFTPGP
ncbi:protein kinase [Actinoplanes sp. NBC_00393]|uniref:protein kinase domain-containing protein n=1 Tax=Actinoplanes sp. NBC_00393 TaxID=2975953 RepID=UPI002E245281